MTYNPKTHLLRPLEPGEIIEEGDLRINFAECRIQETSSYITGMVFDLANYTPHFRPVPIPATGWRPRSEAHLIKDEPPFSTIVWRSKYLNYGTAVSYKNDPPPIGCSHFYIIPPCDIPPLDPERERFEKWIVLRGFNIERESDGEYRYETARNSWIAWQAAARKENV